MALILQVNIFDSPIQVSVSGHSHLGRDRFTVFVLGGDFGSLPRPGAYRDISALKEE